jgi:hypothetical protein
MSALTNARTKTIARRRIFKPPRARLAIYPVDYAEGPSRSCLRGRWVSDQTFRHDTLCRWPLVLTG